jgi:hypothetical protein
MRVAVIHDEYISVGLGAGLGTGEHECSSTVMLNKTPLRVEEKYRGVAKGK